MSVLAMIVVLLAVGASSPGADPPPSTQPATASAPARSDSPEEKLWQEIVALKTEPPATQPQSAWFEALIRQRQAVAEKARLYLTLYPGGRHHVEAVRVELATLYELGALRGGAYDPLCTRIQEHLHQARPDNPAVWEAAYWDILCCRRLHRGPAVTQPTSAPVRGADDALLAAYWEYVGRYPRSPYVPRMAALLFEHALHTGDEPRMRLLADMLTEGFPDHAITASLEAQWRREQAVGQPFSLAFEQPDGPRVDTREFIGRPVLIVVWTSTDAQAVRCVRSVERFRREHPQVRVVGVNLDMSRAEMTAACEKLGIDWPQFNDGLGPANHFARKWGVRRVPRVFVVDREGRLVGSSEDESWERLAVAASAHD